MSAEIVVQQPQSVALTTGDAMAAVMAAAKDPSIDADKLTALVGLAERLQDRGAREEFYRALNAAQQEMPRIPKRGVIISHKTGKEQSRYARLEDVDERVRPIYERHGFAVTFPGAQIRDGRTIYLARVMHRAGHVEEYSMPLATDTSGSKNETQGAGSTMSYARRYLLKSIFHVIEEGEDNDGNDKPQSLTPEQIATLREKCDMSNMAYAALAKVYGAETLETIRPVMYGAAAGLLNARLAKQGAGK
jgi:hypothetical protein